MLVRIERTCSVEATGEAGLPRRAGRFTLYVGSSRDLPEEVAQDLIDRGLATRLPTARDIAKQSADELKYRIPAMRTVRELDDLEEAERGSEARPVVLAAIRSRRASLARDKAASPGANAQTGGLPGQPGVDG